MREGVFAINEVRAGFTAAENDEGIALAIVGSSHHLTRTIGRIDFIVSDSDFALGLTHNQYWLGSTRKSPGPGISPMLAE